MILTFEEFEYLKQFLESQKIASNVETLNYQQNLQSTRKIGPYIYWKTNFPGTFKYNFLLIKNFNLNRVRGFSL